MWRDCTDLLQEALRRFPRQEFFQGQETALVSSTFEDALRDPGLQRPRPPVLADLGTPLAFAIGKASILAGGPGPEAFATRLLQCLSDAEKSAFTFVVARGGYINIEFPEEAKDAFIPKLFSLPFSEILSPDLSLSEDALRERLTLVQDEHLKEFLALPPSAEARLMMLGALAEAELDLEPFLRGLSGKQNLPWLVNRFQRDLAHVRGLLTAGGESESSPVLLSTFLRKNRDRLIWLRWSWEKAVRLGRAEEFFHFLLGLLHENYSFLNRPDFRLCLQGPMRTKERDALQRCLQFLEELMAQSLKRLTKGLPEAEPQKRE